MSSITNKLLPLSRCLEYSMLESMRLPVISDKATPKRFSPVAIPGRYFFFWLSLPSWSIKNGAIRNDPMNGYGATPFPSDSETLIANNESSPRPPNASGTIRLLSPSSFRPL